MMEDLLFKACRKLRFGSSIIENAKRIEKNDNISFLLELFTLSLYHNKHTLHSTLRKTIQYGQMS